MQKDFLFRQLKKIIEYIFDVIIDRPYNVIVVCGKSVVNDGLAKHFPEVKFIESDNDLDHAGDIDYLGMIDEKAFGIQIKSITAKANFGNYSISERMRANF